MVPEKEGGGAEDLRIETVRALEAQAAAAKRVANAATRKRTAAEGLKRTTSDPAMRAVRPSSPSETEIADPRGDRR